MNWKPGNTAPKDGTRVWGWLYDSGIHLMAWDVTDDAWVKVADHEDGDYQIEWWLPENAISPPTGVAFIPGRNRWRDVAPSSP